MNLTNQKLTNRISLTTHKFTTAQTLKQYDMFYKTHLTCYPFLAKLEG